MNNVLKITVWSGLFLVLLIPLFVSNSLYFPFITGKNFALRIIVELVFGAWMVLAIRDQAFRPKWSWITGSILAFLGVTLVANLFGENPYRSFWSNFERMDGWITILHLFLYFLVASSMLNTEKLWRNFLNTSLGVSLVAALVGISEMFKSEQATRIDATFGNPIYLAIYSVFHIFISLYLLVKTDNRTWKWIYTTMAVLHAFILYNTGTRGAMLGLLGGLCVSALFVIIFEKENKIVKRTGIAIIAGVVLLVLGFIGIKDTSFVKESPVLNRFASISLKGAAGQGRELIWPLAIQGFKERPLLGWGQENFTYIFSEHYNPKMYAQEQWFDRTHNVVLDWLVSGGILGLLAYLSLFGVALYSIYRREGGFTVLQKSIFIGLLSAYFIHNFFVFDNIVSYILFFSVLAYIHFKVTESKESIRFNWKAANNQIVHACILIATVGIVYVLNFKPLYASYLVIDAMSAAAYKDFDRSLVKYEKVLTRYSSFGDTEIKVQLMNNALQSTFSQAPDETKKRLLTLTYRQLKEEVDKNPNDTRSHLFLGTFLSNLNEYEEAETVLKRAHELSPGKQTILFEIAANYVGSKEYDKALEVMRQAFELEPSFDEARKIYAVTAVYAGEEKLSETLLIERYGVPVIPDERLLRAYLAQGNEKRIIEISEMKVEAEPYNLQYRISLAAAYLRSNLRDKAILTIVGAVSLDPGFKDQAEYYVREIEAGRTPIR